MGATKYWLRKKKSKAEKDDHRKKSSTGNVKRNSSGTSSSPNHLRASDGSCLDVCTCKKGHFSPVKAWNPTPERTTSPFDTQKDIRSPFEKLKISTAQLKPSLNVRTNSSPAVNNKLSAVKLQPSPDSNHSPGITKTEIPLLSKKFHVINRHPSDSRIFKYNESVISSPNSSPDSTGKLVVGSPFSSPTSLIGTRKTAIQSRDITGTPKTSLESTASLSMEPFVSPFGRKFSSRGLFSAGQNQKKGKAESKKSFNEKDQVLPKNLDSIDSPIENKILEREQSDSIIKISPSTSPLSQPVSKFPSISLLSRPTVKFADDNDGAKILHVNDEKTENNMSDHEQTNGHSQNSPSTIPLSELVKEFTHERNEPQNLHMADAETKNEVLEPMNGKIQISPSTSPSSCPEVKLTHDSDKAEIFYLDDLASKNGLVEPVQIDGHKQISPSTFSLSKPALKLNLNKNQVKNTNVDDAATENGNLEPMQIKGHIQMSTSTSPLLQDQAKILHMVDEASKNQMLEPVQTDGHSHTLPSTFPLSQYAVRFTHEHERAKNLNVNHDVTENEMLKPVQTNGHIQISPSPTSLSKSDMKLTHDKDQTKDLHVDDVKTKNEVLEPMQTDMTFIDDTDQVKIWHMSDAEVENEMSESMQTNDQRKISSSASPLFRSSVTLTQDNDREKIFYMIDRVSDDEMLEHVQTDGHIHISQSTTHLSPHGVTLTHDNERAKNSHVNDATENEMLKPIQTDDHSESSQSCSPLSRPTVTLTHDNDQTKILHLNYAATENEMLKFEETDNCSQKIPEEIFYMVDATSRDEMLEMVRADGHHGHISSSTSPLSEYGVPPAQYNDKVKHSHMNDAASENDMLEPLQTDGLGKVFPSASPLSRSAVTLTHDNDQAKIFHVNGATTVNKRLQNDCHSQISPSTSPLSKSVMKLTLDKDHEKNLLVDDAMTKDKMLKDMRIEGHSQISLSASPVSQPDGKLTNDNDQVNLLYTVDVASKNEMLQQVQTDGHNHISPFAHDNDMMNILHVNDTATKNEMLEPIQTEGRKISSSTKILHVSDATTENEMMEPVKTDGHGQIPSSTSSLSGYTMTLTRDNDREKFLHTNGGITENEMSEPVQTEGLGQISPSTFQSSQSASKLTRDKKQRKNLHVDNATTDNEILEPLQTDFHNQISPSTSLLSQSSMIFNNQTKILHPIDTTTRNEKLELVQTNDHSQISLSTSLLSQPSVKLTHENDQTKIFHVVDATTSNEMLDSDGHLQISTSISPLSMSTVKLARDDDQAKILHVVERTENEMLELVQTDGHIQNSHSTSSFFQSQVLSDAHSEPLPCHADVLAEPEYTDGEELYEDIDGEALENFEYIDSYDSEDSEFAEETDEIKLENVDVVNINKGDTAIGLHHKNPDKGKQYASEDEDFCKCTFRRGSIVNENGTKTYVGMRRFQIREIDDNANANTPNSKYSDSYHSEDSGCGDAGTDGFKPESGDGVHISRADTLKGKHRRNSRNDKQFSSVGGHLAYKRKFWRGRIVDLQSENEVPVNLKFRRGRVVEDDDGTKTCVGKIRFKKREIVGNTKTSRHDSEYIDNYYSEDSEFTESEHIEFSSENDDFLNINRVDLSKGGYHKNPREGEKFTSKKYSPAYKCEFRRGRIADYSDGSEYAQSETVERNPENGEAASIDRVDLLQGRHHRNPRKGKQFIMEEDSPAYKCKFRRGRIVNLQMDNDVPRRLKFRRGRIIENEDGTKTYVRRRRFKKREIVDDVNATSPDSEKVVLRHQEMQEKKDDLCLFNDVIEETVTILSKSRKSKVKALVGAFETVISLQDDRTPPGELSRSPLLTPQ